MKLALNGLVAADAIARTNRMLHLPLYIRVLIKRNRREITFIGKFIFFYVIGQVIYILLRPSISPFLTANLTAAASTHVINLFMPSEHVSASGTMISGSVSLNIVTGCDGMEGFILIISAICAFPALISRKCAGIGIGTIVIYIANLLRVVALYSTLKLHPDAFSFMHMYVGQVYIVFAGFMFFLVWAGRSTGSNSETKVQFR
jgi:exosortase family protein XrtM